MNPPIESALAAVLLVALVAIIAWIIRRAVTGGPHADVAEWGRDSESARRERAHVRAALRALEVEAEVQRREYHGIPRKELPRCDVSRGSGRS